MKRLVMLSTVAMLLALAPAKAAQFDYSSIAVNQGQNITLSGIVSEQVDAGQIVLTGTGPNAGSSADVWCVDVFDHLMTSGIFNLTPLTTAGAGSPNPTLTSVQINQMGALMIAGDADILNDKLGVDTSVAFQLAIWAVEYGGTLLDNADSTLAALVTALVADVQPGGSLADPNARVTLFDAAAQNQVLATGFDVSTVPLPGTIWLMAGALGLFGGMVGRRKKSPSAFAA